MQKHIEMDEPEETPDLEQTLFGVADPIGPIISEDEIDEEAVEGELEEDMLLLEVEDADETGEIEADETEADEIEADEIEADEIDEIEPSGEPLGDGEISDEKP
jgi:hypothetical protein